MTVAALGEKRVRALAVVDSMPRGLRECARDFGYPIVQACLDAGVSDVRRIRQLVHSIWCGAREPGQRGDYGAGSGSSSIIGQLDWLLLQNGSALTAHTLVRVLREHNMVIMPLEPTTQGVTASIGALDEAHIGIRFGKTITTERKHITRLRAALNATARHLWPQLFTDKP